MNNGDTGGRHDLQHRLADDPDEARLLAAIRQQLDHSCASLDGQTLSRLHRIRSAAIEQRHPAWTRLWLPVGSLVTACALALMVGQGWHVGRTESSLDVVENVEILAADEDLDFYRDYEFYQWLSQN